MSNTRIDVDNVLSQMRMMRTQAQGKSPIGPGADIASNPLDKIGGAQPINPSANFGKVLTSAIDKVNDTQAEAGKLAKAYELGDPNVSLTDVMVQSQKASISFQAMTQVRNKLVDAYQEIMNMPI
jgi:flagellar hook-basal body complex protein FliE